MIKQFHEITPVSEHGIIYRNPNSFFGYCGWPTVAIDEKGVLYAVVSGFRAAHICPFGKTVLFKSFDFGKTWSIPMVINDTYLDDRDAGVLSLGGETILVTWFTHPTELYRNVYKEWITNDWCVSGDLVEKAYPTIPQELAQGGSYVRVSGDGGMTWGDTVKVPISAPHGPIKRRDGSLLYLGREMYNTEPDGVVDGDICAYESSDDGKTWKLLGKVPLDPAWEDPCEAHVLELENGRLLGMIRVWDAEVQLTTFRTVSDDGGYTWSFPEAMGTNGAPPHLMRHSSGAIILTYGRRTEPFGQRALISRDNGETWEDEYILRDDGPDHDLGYPSTVELPDGSLLTVYYQKVTGDRACSLLWTRWQL